MPIKSKCFKYFFRSSLHQTDTAIFGCTQRGFFIRLGVVFVEMIAIKKL